MSDDSAIRHAVYRHFAETGEGPTTGQTAERAGVGDGEVIAAYRRLAERRLLVLEPDGESIRMAPPFSGVPTQHVFVAGQTRYFANCAWDVLGVPAALRRSGSVESRCEGSGEPLKLRVDFEAGPEASSWLFHCLVPAAHWWDDIVFT